MTISRSERILVIGIGNAFRRDDGAGIEVLRKLAGRGLEGVESREESGEGASLMEAWRGFDTVILIDAVSSGSPEGTIHVLDPMERRIPSEFFHYSTHAFGVAEAVELARALGRLPARMRIYGIEGKDFGSGEGCTPEVERSLREVVRLLDEVLNARCGEENPLEAVPHA